MPSWTPAVDVMSNEPLYLTTAGSMEAFNLGVELRQRYGFTPGGENLTVW
jgi:acid phosphatase